MSARAKEIRETPLSSDRKECFAYFASKREGYKAELYLTENELRQLAAYYSLIRFISCDPALEKDRFKELKSLLGTSQVNKINRKIGDIEMLKQEKENEGSDNGDDGFQEEDFDLHRRR